ncbi:carboxymuconolactone decarboxylase family protein [Hymenobacter saemangeumensis]|uniref:Carboxymuconolactone decarboxylase family protein n=1 Tax=Hymenobacter saemangeumensis TaxID=1084522 RepID=A0ABP8I0T3_9BACT
MARFHALNPAAATGKALDLLTAVQNKLGVTPNMMRTMASSPAVLDAYLAFSGALSKGSLGGKLGEQIALAVAEANSCQYCASAHAVLGQRAGLDDAAIQASRRGAPLDARTDAALRFARTLVARQGLVTATDVAAVRAAGLSEGEVGEIIAHVALNTFTNYFNNTAETDIDFPVVELLEKEVA